MKKASLLKLLALVLAFAMVATVFVGCGKGNTNSDVSSDVLVDEGDDWDLGDDLDVDVDNSNVSKSGNNSQGGSSGGNKTTTINTNVSTGTYGLKYSDNTAIFDNIPSELKGKTVQFADWGEASADEYQKVVAKFQNDTGIKVKMMLYSEADFITQVAQQIAAGASLDIAACNSTYPQALEVVQPLPKIFDIHDGFWDERVSEATKVGSKYYFVNTRNSPFTGGYVVYYNKKIFNNNGLTSPQDYYDNGNWSYENLFTCMQDAKKVGFNGGVLESMTLAEQMGTSLINYDPATGTFTGSATDENLISALKYMAKAVDEGLAGNYGITNFTSGQIGICMAGTYGTKYNGYFKELSPSDIGVVPLPTSYNGKTLTSMPLGYRGYGICKGSKNAEGAYYFLRYFLDLDKYEGAGANIFANKVLEKYFRQTQLVLFQNSPLYFEYFQGVLNMIGKGWGTNEWTEVRHAAESQVASLLKSKEQILDSAAKTATEKLKSYV